MCALCCRLWKYCVRVQTTWLVVYTHWKTREGLGLTFGLSLVSIAQLCSRLIDFVGLFSFQPPNIFIYPQCAVDNILSLVLNQVFKLNDSDLQVHFFALSGYGIVMESAWPLMLDALFYEEIFMHFPPHFKHAVLLVNSYEPACDLTIWPLPISQRMSCTLVFVSLSDALVYWNPSFSRSFTSQILELNFGIVSHFCIPQAWEVRFIYEVLDSISVGGSLIRLLGGQSLLWSACCMKSITWNTAQLGWVIYLLLQNGKGETELFQSCW